MTEKLPLAHRLPDTSVDLLVGTVGDALRNTAALFPKRRALVWPDGAGDAIGVMTYAELLAEAEQTAAWLLARAAPGSCIAIWSRNSVEWILVEYGCALAGMTVASWNPAWTDFECRHARDLTNPALLLAGYDTRGASLLQRAAAIMEGELVHPLEELRSLIVAARLVPFPPVQPSDPFLIQFTSGTTGKAKGASMSHRTALNGAWLRVVAADADESDVWINPVPLNHMGGAVSLVVGCMTVGACYVVMTRFDPAQFVRLMRLCGATRIGGVPTMIYALLDQPGWAEAARDLRSVGSGGAQVPRPLIERLMRDYGVTVLVAFAQSECPMISATLPGEDPLLAAETVGRPIAHTELKVCDPQTGATLGTGDVGEICVRGPVVMDGYYRMPEATAATIDVEGFLHTGDLGSLDAAGYIRIHGRARDVIIRGGENIYPAEVEDCLLTHPDVYAVAVVAVPDARWGHVVGAGVQLRDGAITTAEELEAHVAERIAHFKIPRRWRFVESFPLTPSGKIRKVEVEALFV
jgi:fatty-acyl-CoA synthase